MYLGTSLWLRICAPNARDLGSIPHQGSGFHMPQLRTLHAATAKISRATTKTWYRQNKRREREKKCLSSQFSLHGSCILWSHCKHWIIASWWMKVSEEHLRKPLAITFFLTEQQIILLYICFYFRTPYLKHIVDSLTLNSWKTTRYLMNEWNLINIPISHKTYCSLLAARNTGQNFSTGLWGHFKWKNCQEKEKKKKKCGKCGTK